MIKTFTRMSCSQCMRLAVNVRTWQPTEQEWQLTAQCVQREEKERIGKFVFQRDAKLSMVGRLLIRKVLSGLTGIAYRDIQLGRTDKGKPLLINRPAAETVSFNVGHHGDYAVIAADVGRSVGIDIMQIEKRKDMKKFFQTLHRQLTPQEWDTVESRGSDRDKMAMFFRLWCLKESYVKALGTGIGFEVGRLDFHISTPELSTSEVVSDTVVHVDGTLQSDWSFEETMLDDDHCVAVGSTPRRKVDDDNKAMKFQFLTPPDLLASCEVLVDAQPDQEYWETFSSRLETPKARQS